MDRKRLAFRQNLWCTLSVALRASLVAPLCAPVPAFAEPNEGSIPLHLETKVSLGKVRGRIDHMAIDIARQRLLVAELGNDSVGVVDLKEGKTERTLMGLAEPQGIAFVPSTDTVYVANAGDGSVRLLQGAEYTPVGRIDLGRDADNVRFDSSSDHILVGYGSGAIASVDIVQPKRSGEVALPAHPESFQIASTLNRVFVNVPEVRSIIVIDRAAGRQTANWPLHESGNFAMAFDKANNRILVVSRNPPRLVVRTAADGSAVATVETCGDSDDLFVDERRQRVYVSCGVGFVDVFEATSERYSRIARIPTMPGARTSLFVPELDRLYVAVRASATTDAAIWVFRPSP